MTPRDVDQLTPEEYRAFMAYADRDLRAQARAARRRAK
jgi:hypothetical protein